MARQLSTQRPDAGTRAALREPPAHLDRNQLNVLRFAEAGDVPEVARRDARRIRVQRQGAEVRDAYARISRTAASSVERFLESGVLELGHKLGPINWQLAPESDSMRRSWTAFLALLPRKLQGRALRHALEVRHPSFDCKEFVALARERQVGRRRGRRFGVSTDPGAQRPLQLLRLMGTKAGSAEGLPPAALARWREQAQTSARDGDVFLYFISGAKERNPQAARALLAALSRVEANQARLLC